MSLAYIKGLFTSLLWTVCPRDLMMLLRWTLSFCFGKSFWAKYRHKLNIWKSIFVLYIFLIFSGTISYIYLMWTNYWIRIKALEEHIYQDIHRYSGLRIRIRPDTGVSGSGIPDSGLYTWTLRLKSIKLSFHYSIYWPKSF